nr:MAG TPA: hypothetical protein [Caudoviricetes sp.]
MKEMSFVSFFNIVMASVEEKSNSASQNDIDMLFS